MDNLNSSLARWLATAYYDGPNEVPNGTKIGKCGFKRENSVWMLSIEVVYPVSTEEEADKLTSKAIQEIDENIKVAISSLNLTTDSGYYHVLSKDVGIKISLPNNTNRIKTDLNARYKTKGPPLNLSSLPDNDILSVVSKSFKNKGLETMISLFETGKKLEEENSRFALLLYYMVAEACAWDIKRKKTDSKILDEEIKIESDDIIKAWNDFKVGELLDHLESNPDIKANANLKKEGPLGESPVLKAIRLSRHKRMIGHGVSKDPLPSVRLPIEEVRIMAKQIIIGYGMSL